MMDVLVLLSDEAAVGLRAALLERGAKVHLAGDGGAAARRCVNEPPEVAVLELTQVSEADRRSIALAGARPDGPAIVLVRPEGDETPLADLVPGVVPFDVLRAPVASRRLAMVVRRAATHARVAHDRRRWEAAETAFDRELEEEVRGLERTLAATRATPGVRRRLAIALPERIGELMRALRGRIAAVLEMKLPIDPSCVAALEDAVTAADRLLRMSLDLRDAALAEAGALTPAWQEVELEPLIGQVAASQARLAGDFQSRVVLEIEGALGSIVSDPELLARLLVNLVERAVRQSRRGLVTVHACRTGHLVRLAVRDTGTVVPNDLEGRLFESTTRLLPGGSVFHRGMGLPFCRAATIALGGRIDVKAHSGSGSSFDVTLDDRKAAGALRRVA